MVDSDATGGPPTQAEIARRLRQAGCVFAEDEAALLLAAADADRLESLIRARIDGHPLEHLLGWAEFAGLRIRVGPGVFVPRRRSELLVDLALAALLRHPPGTVPVVLDLCCGSGAVATALLARVADTAPALVLELHAADLDPACVGCARQNLAGRATVHQGDLFGALPASLRGRIDVLVANAPYVPSQAVGSMPAEAREHEPLVALDGGPDGLDVLRRIVGAAADWLAPGGLLAIETSERQRPAALAAFTAAGFDPTAHHADRVDGTAVSGVLRGLGTN